MLGTDRVRVTHRHLWISVGVPGTGQGVHRVRAAPELVLQPVPVRHTHQAVQKGLRDDMQSDRGVPGDPGHRPVPAQLQFQQPSDTGQHQQPGGPVVPGPGLPASAVQLQRETAGRQVRQGGRDVLRLAERQVPEADVVPATGIRFRSAVHAKRPVRVPDSRDPAEATQTGVVHVEQRELQLVPFGFVAATPPSPSSSSLWRAAPVAGPETAAGQLVDSDPENVPGLQPVQLPERQLGLGEHGQHERQHQGVQVERRRRGQVSEAQAHPPVGRARRGRTAAGGRRRWRVAEQTHRPVPGHHTVGGREQRAPGRHRGGRGRLQDRDDGRFAQARQLADDYGQREDVHAARFQTFVTATQLKRNITATPTHDDVNDIVNNDYVVILNHFEFGTLDTLPVLPPSRS